MTIMTKKMTLRQYIEQYAPVAKQMWNEAQSNEERDTLFILVPSLTKLEEELLESIIEKYSEKEIMDEFDIVDRKFGYIFSHKLDEVEEPLLYVANTVLAFRLYPIDVTNHLTN